MSTTVDATLSVVALTFGESDSWCRYWQQDWDQADRGREWHIWRHYCIWQYTWNGDTKIAVFMQTQGEGNAAEASLQIHKPSQWAKDVRPYQNNHRRGKKVHPNVWRIMEENTTIELHKDLTSLKTHYNTHEIKMYWCWQFHSVYYTSQKNCVYSSRTATGHSLCDFLGQVRTVTQTITVKIVSAGVSETNPRQSIQQPGKQDRTPLSWGAAALICDQTANSSYCTFTWYLHR